MKHSMILSVLTLCVPIMAQQRKKPLLRIALTSGSTSQTGQVFQVQRSKCDGMSITIAQDKADHFLEASTIPPDVRYV
jgi:hypothetical protein